MIRALPLLFSLAALAAAPLTARATDALATAPAHSAKFIEIPATKTTLELLRSGGFTLYMRHGHTDNQRADQAPAVDLNDCATQRPLTEEGRQTATRVGEALRQARIPIGEIHASPLCRAKETTAAAFPASTFTLDPDLMYTANLTDAQKAPILENTRRLLSTPPAPGSNRLLVAHAPNLMDLIGYFPKEATVVIFRPQGDAGFEYIASIPPGLWPELLAP